MTQHDIVIAPHQEARGAWSCLWAICTRTNTSYMIWLCNSISCYTTYIYIYTYTHTHTHVHIATATSADAAPV